MSKGTYDIRVYFDLYDSENCAFHEVEADSYEDALDEGYKIPDVLRVEIISEPSGGDAK